MYKAKIFDTKETKEGTWLKVLIPHESKTDEVNRLKGNGLYLGGSIYFDDGRFITGKQQRAIFAIVRDMADWWADDPEYTRKVFQEAFCLLHDIDAFSLSHFNSNCATVTIARHFITYLLEVCLQHSIPLKEGALKLTDDIDRYLYLCIKYAKCCICGKDGELHHWDAIGAGRDRKTYDDTSNRKIQLCRHHHTEAHQIGRETFTAKYKVYGIKYKERD